MVNNKSFENNITESNIFFFKQKQHLSTLNKTQVLVFPDESYAICYRDQQESKD